MIWVTADHHFDHKNIIKYCDRPFNSVEEMNYLMIKRWNKKINKQDLVIHLGDFALTDKKRIEEIANKLKGEVILIKGNHDKDKRFKGTKFVVTNNQLKIGNLVLTHRLKQVSKNKINIHGHAHEKDSKCGINVSVDKTEFYPVSLNSIIGKDRKHRKNK